MYFYVLNGTKLFTGLDKIRREIQKAKNASNAFAKSLGAKDVYISHYIAGGADGFGGFASPPDMKKWRHVGQKWQQIYYPRSIPSNKELFEKIRALPRIDEDGINKLIGFTPGFVSGDSVTVLMVHIKSPKVMWGDKYILIEIDDRIKGYKKNKDMKELKYSEFLSMEKRIEGKKEKATA